MFFQGDKLNKIFIVWILTVLVCYSQTIVATNVVYDPEIKPRPIYFEGDELKAPSATIYYPRSRPPSRMYDFDLVAVAQNGFSNAVYTFTGVTTNRDRLDLVNAVVTASYSNFTENIIFGNQRYLRVVPKWVGRPQQFHTIVNNSILPDLIFYDGSSNQQVNVVWSGGELQKTLNPESQVLVGPVSNFISTVEGQTFVEGSLGKHMQDEIISRVVSNGYDNTRFNCLDYSGNPTGWSQITGSPLLIDDPSGWTTPSDMLWKTYHTWGYGYTRTLKRNPTNVLKDVDLSCVSIMNNAQGKNQQAGTLITEKHLVNADHFSTANGFNVGTKVIFMSTNSLVHTGVVAKTVNVYGDIRLYELTQEVPAYIVPCKVMATNWATYLPTRNSDLHNPYMFFVDQRKHVVLTEMGFGPNFLRGLVYNGLGIMWDSGCPVFALVNGKPVLSTVFTSPVSGTSISDSITLINNQIEAWGSTNRVYVVDLNEFN